MGRRPIGRKAMTPARRRKRYRRNLHPDRTKLKQKARRAREAALAAATVKAPLALGSKHCGVIYPWSRETGMDRAADNHYPTMPLDQIKAVKVPAAKNCVLFLWAIASMLPASAGFTARWSPH